MSEAPVQETAPCYCCGGTSASPAGRAWLLPVLSAHVRCGDCGKTFNARTGQSNTPVFAFLTACGGIGLLVGIVLYAYSVSSL